MKHVTGHTLSCNTPHGKRFLTRWPCRPFPWILLLILLFSPVHSRAAAGEEMGPTEHRIELIIQDFSHRLGITQQIVFSMVPGDTLLASVRPVLEDSDVFQISFDPKFIQTLDDGELCAAVAHELGHVWIYTHFPYLQTEVLANRQALKLVSRSDLGRIYEKVWKWKGERGDPEKVFGSLDEFGGSRDTK